MEKQARTLSSSSAPTKKERKKERLIHKGAHISWEDFRSRLGLVCCDSTSSLSFAVKPGGRNHFHVGQLAARAVLLILLFN